MVILRFHGSSETTLACNVAFLGILMHLFQKNIASMSGMLLLMFVQHLLQFGARGGGWEWEGYYGEKNKIILTCPFESHWSLGRNLIFSKGNL